MDESPVKKQRPAPALGYLRPSQLLYVMVGVMVGAAWNTVMPGGAGSVGAAVAVPKPQPPLRLVVLSPAAEVRVVVPPDPEDKTKKVVFDSVLGDHKNPFPDIPFPLPLRPKPAKERRNILVVVLPGFGTWDSKTLPLLEYLVTCPDAIDVAVIEDPSEEDFANKVVALGMDVIRSQEPTLLSRADAINAGWMHFRRSPKYELLVFVQNDVKVYHGVFDKLLQCSLELPHAAVVGPTINAMQVGEKSTPMDEQLLSSQNAHHRRNRVFLQGHIPKDCHARLPYTLREHNEWLERALSITEVTNASAPADRLQSFMLAFGRRQPTLPGDVERIVADDYNLFEKDFEGLVDASVNGRPGDRSTGRFSFYEDARVPRFACLTSFVYKDWRAEGMIESALRNQWFVPARRNPKDYPPPREALWDRT